ncbi:hypothetical protein ACET3Z_024524 [Daucus carota]
MSYPFPLNIFFTKKSRSGEISDEEIRTTVSESGSDCTRRDKRVDQSHVKETRSVRDTGESSRRRSRSPVIRNDNTIIEDGHNYFEKLNDKLIVESIFTKLSSSDANNSLDDIKSLGQCSTVCKRFNALTCQVSKLRISHASIAVLCKYCPVIFKKFNNVYSIQVKHLSFPYAQILMPGFEGFPVIHWEAAYRPHSYSLALISYKKQSLYFDHQQWQHLMRSDATTRDLSALMREHCLDLIYLHHMLVLSIKDHKSLQRLVVTDFRNRGTLTLKEDMLRELRDCRTTNLKQVRVRDRSSSVINFDIPDHVEEEEAMGVVLNNLSFNIIEWWEESTDDQLYNYEDGDDLNILLGLRQGILKHVLKSLLKNTADIDIKFNDGRITLKLLSELMSDCKTPGYFC